MPPWVQPGQMMDYSVVLISVMSEDEYKKDAEEKAARQIAIDDYILKEYFKKNKITPMKTASGLYYTIEKEGEGDNAKKGEVVTANYTGKLLEGKTFDSNTDSAFHHVQPYGFTVGKGIRGWDEGLQLMKKGSKAVFYIPSTLAYGPQDQKGIPANSILVFNVEALNIESPAAQGEKDDKLLQEYFTKNNITPTKTQSGMYYVITRKGLGPMAKPGKKVTMNYTGKLMDGTVFDSNTDPSKGHVSPFSFTLGVGQVIRGWDEGVQLLNMGAKATFYLPSGMAYGPQGNQGIPPNSNLIFDVEMLSIDK
jgi:FKBP-type peptidyl-prolyl cis-trans isomerase